MILDNAFRDKYRSIPLWAETYVFDFINNTYPGFMRPDIPVIKQKPAHDHSHEEPEIIHINKGEMDFYVNYNLFRLKPGDTLLISPYMNHSASFVPGTDLLEYSCLVFNFDIFSVCKKHIAEDLTALKKGEKRFPTLLPDNVSDIIGKKMKDIESALMSTENQDAGDIAAGAGVWSIMSDILSVGLEKTSAPERRDIDFIERVGHYIESHYHMDITSESVSDAIGYNRNYFCTLFKKNFGTSFSCYLCEYRLERAANNYHGSSIPLKDIMGAVGFTNYSYFSRAFKNRFGVSPSCFFKR